MKPTPDEIAAAKAYAGAVRAQWLLLMPHPDSLWGHVSHEYSCGERIAPTSANPHSSYRINDHLSTLLLDELHRLFPEYEHPVVAQAIAAASGNGVES